MVTRARGKQIHVKSEENKVARDELISICERFDNPHSDLLTNPARYVIKTGVLNRQATRFKRKQVDRWCILCNDIFVFTQKKDKIENGKLELKQIIDLKTATIDDQTEGKTSMKDSICIITPEREFVIGAKDSIERNSWAEVIISAIITIKSDKTVNSKMLPRNKKDSRVKDIHTVHLGTIHSAAQMGNLKLMQSLLNKPSFNINELDANGDSALHIAAVAGHTDVVSILLDKNIDINMQNKEGRTPLHMSALSGQLAIVKQLFEGGAKSLIVDNRNQTPLQSFILNEPLKKNQSVQFYKEMVSTLCSDVDDHKTNNSETLLHMACRTTNTIAIRALLDLDASLQSISNRGQTPLHYASMCMSLEACKLLVERGASPCIRDHALNTPLHIATSIEVAIYLISHGGRTDLKNSDNCISISNFTDSEEIRKINEAREVYIKKGDREVEPDFEGIQLFLDKEKDWVRDNISDSCLLCQDSFTFRKRKHHCRLCGLLICGQCSTKRFYAAPNDDGYFYSLYNKSPKNISKGIKDPEGTRLRCCDSCYNIITYSSKPN